MASKTALVLTEDDLWIFALALKAGFDTSMIRNPINPQIGKYDLYILAGLDSDPAIMPSLLDRVLDFQTKVLIVSKYSGDAEMARIYKQKGVEFVFSTQTNEYIQGLLEAIYKEI